jgi:hypothetical protein
MKIVIETIDNSLQRYKTCGDYWIDADGTWQIRVSKMSCWQREFLVAIHELAEMAQCIHKGIKEEDISIFDIQFEKERELGLHTPEEEPGDSIKAPYREEHFIATNIERVMSVPLQVLWSDYDNEIVSF